uniref:Uncharacterized protein n=1 Tax=Acrobeloides nanus TaxID=290746 RepID=A0A914E874_9BILA
MIPLNNIFLLGASPPDEVISDITSLLALQNRQVSVIGVPLNNQVTISPSIINAGITVVPWNNDHNALTIAIRSKMKC